MSIDFETTFADSIHWELQIIVRFAEPEAEASLHASDLRYTDADGVRLLWVGDPTDNEFLKSALSNDAVRGTTVRVSVSEETSELTMEFRAVGMTIAALPLPQYEGWEAHFDPAITDGVSLVVCVGGGELVEFGPPQRPPT